MTRHIDCRHGGRFGCTASAAIGVGSAVVTGPGYAVM